MSPEMALLGPGETSDVSQQGRGKADILSCRAHLAMDAVTAYIPDMSCDELQARASSSALGCSDDPGPAPNNPSAAMPARTARRQGGQCPNPPSFAAKIGAGGTGRNFASRAL